MNFQKYVSNTNQVPIARFSLPKRQHHRHIRNFYSLPLVPANPGQIIRHGYSLGSMLSSCLKSVRKKPRSRTCCFALSERDGEPKEVDPTSLQAAAESMELVWYLACQRDEDALLGFFPDHVLDQAAQLRLILERGGSLNDPSSGVETSSTTSTSTSTSSSQPQSQSRQGYSRPVTLRDVVQQAHAMKGFTFDSFATRHLYVSPPSHNSVRRLSCIRTSSNRAILRYAVAVEGGEKAVLTFGLECEERLAPHYRSARVEFVWQLVSVTGEPIESATGGGEEGERTRGPNPSLPPEAVINAQLEALAREDIATVFAFASPANKAVTGPLERFTKLLRNPMYLPLLRHRSSEQINFSSLRPGHHNAVVKIVSDNTGMPQGVEMMFYWVLSRQSPGTGPHENCWMTDSVELLDARTL